MRHKTFRAVMHKFHPELEHADSFPHKDPERTEVRGETHHSGVCGNSTRLLKGFFIFTHLGTEHVESGD